MRYLGLLSLLFVTLLAGCGGGGGSTPELPPAVTYNISGTITGAVVSGVSITLSGTASKSTTTGANGTYSFSGLANGSYTVTPTAAANFLPVSTGVTVSGANVTGMDFVSSPPSATTYSISGTVGGAASSGVTISVGAAGSVVTGAGGTYTISGLAAGNYTVTPALTGFTFSPASINVTSLTANSSGNNFTATAIPVPHSISGTVSGAISAGVTMTLTGGGTTPTTTTASDGSYSFAGVYDGTYTVTPSLTGYTFNPNSSSVTMNGANITGKNYVSSVYVAPTYSLSGTITAAWVDGVTVTLGGDANATTTTNASGNYSFANLPAGTYTVTPSLTGYTYSPSTSSVPVNANATQNFTASSAVTAYSISGTVGVTTAQTCSGSPTCGGIAIRAYPNGCISCGVSSGTVVMPTGANTAYTIRGVPAGNYVVVAEADMQGTNVANANNPIGMSETVNVATANVTGININATDLTPPTPVTPSLDGVFPGPSSAFISYTGPVDADGQEIASSYKLSWGTDTAASNGGSSNFKAVGNSLGFYEKSGFTNGQVLYFKLQALVGTTPSAASTVVGPITIGATTGANTVSGTVTFPAATAGTPLIVGLFGNGGIYFTKTTATANQTSYSFAISGVPSGSYKNFALLDVNNDGLVDAGDVTNAGTSLTTIAVSGTTTHNFALSAAFGSADIYTNYWTDGTSNSYGLNIALNDGTKQLTAVTLFSGPNVSVPADLVPTTSTGNLDYIALGSGFVPTVGDQYKFKFTYYDGTSQNVTASVTGVLTSSNLAGNLAVNATPSANTPTFSWTAPATAPAAPYVYNVWVQGIDAYWWYPQNSGLPSTTTSVLYNADGLATGTALTTGTAYTWQIQVQDANRNLGTLQAAPYTP